MQIVKTRPKITFWTIHIRNSSNIARILFADIQKRAGQIIFVVTKVTWVTVAIVAAEALREAFSVLKNLK